MSRVFAAFLLPLPLLASCALGPRVPAPDTRLPAAFEAPSADGAASVDLDRWWRAYNDPQLESLVEAALKSAPDARSAAARLDEARAVRSSALTAFDPQGALQGSSTLTNTNTISGPGPIVIPAVPGVFPGASFDLSPSGYTYNQGANFNVSWEVDLFGRRVATRRRANADFAAARFDYEASRTSLAASVADQLFQARGLAIQLDDSREEARIQRELLRVAQLKADHGLGAQSDADQVAAQTAQSDAEVADLESQLHAARRTLLVLLGRGADPLEGLPTPAEAGAPPKVPASVPGALLARRPDVQEALAKLHSASGQLKIDELALFPKFTLQPGISLSSSNVTGSPIVSDAWSIGLGAALPILDRPRLQAEIRAQGARADQAVIAYEKTVQTAYGEAENALVELSSDERRVTMLTAGEAQGRRAYDAARRRYTMGMDDLTSVLTAERTWRTARTALTGAEVQALRRSVQTFKALGGGWTPPAQKPVRSS
jgi:NodT family efflux transporter outer membrane factor (OMF) lipoprotein